MKFPFGEPLREARFGDVKSWTELSVIGIYCS
jgi:hypothetical protein